MENKNHAREKDPHAHFVCAPGRRLMHQVPLRFVGHKVSGQRPRNPNAPLNLVSFIDCLLMTTIFLLSVFSASGSPCIDKQVRLPSAQNVEDLVEAPMVSVTGGQILVDGTLAGSVRSVTDFGKLEKIGGSSTSFARNATSIGKSSQPGRFLGWPSSRWTEQSLR